MADETFDPIMIASVRQIEKCIGPLLDVMIDARKKEKRRILFDWCEAHPNKVAATIAAAVALCSAIRGRTISEEISRGMP